MRGRSPGAGATYGTLAQLLATPAAGNKGLQWIVTDVGYPYVQMISDGTRWRPFGYQDVLVDATLATGAQATGEQVVRSYALPAGLLHLQNWRFSAAVGKNGTTDAMSNFALRLGTTGTTADAQLAVSNNSVMAAGKQSMGFTIEFAGVDATTLARRGSVGAVDIGSFFGQAAGPLLDGTVAVPSMLANALFLSVTCSMTAATANKPQVSDARLTLLP